MRNFRETICGPCGGKLYPRQCRNSRAWRVHKVAIFDDLADADFDCPAGIELNFLPAATVRPDGRLDYTGCQGCKDKLLRKMKKGTQNGALPA